MVVVAHSGGCLLLPAIAREVGARRAAARAQREDGFEYSQFAGIRSAHTIGTSDLALRKLPHRRGPPAHECTSCGSPPDDSFLRGPSPAP